MAFIPKTFSERKHPNFTVQKDFLDNPFNSDLDNLEVIQEEVLVFKGVKSKIGVQEWSAESIIVFGFAPQY